MSDKNVEQGPVPMKKGDDLDESKVAEDIKLEEEAAAEAWSVFSRSVKPHNKKRPTA